VPGARPQLRRRSAGHRATPHDHDSHLPAATAPGPKRSHASARSQELPQNARRTRPACLQRERALGHRSGALLTARSLTPPSCTAQADPAMPARSRAPAGPCRRSPTPLVRARACPPRLARVPPVSRSPVRCRPRADSTLGLLVLATPREPTVWTIPILALPHVASMQDRGCRARPPAGVWDTPAAGLITFAR